ncbi:SMR family transporter [Peribacillus simplex]|uniref:DMT family transporter n=1 Tax=Peribacillus simplex TaxID=1478 RepID=UPI00288ADF50|nr:SMR family transporter [Peribacillus simplex]
MIYTRLGDDSMAWFSLLIAGFAEIGSVISLKRADGFKKLLPSVACLLPKISIEIRSINKQCINKY